MQRLTLKEFGMEIMLKDLTQIIQMKIRLGTLGQSLLCLSQCLKKQDRKFLTRYFPKRTKTKKKTNVDEKFEKNVQEKINFSFLKKFIKFYKFAFLRF